MKDRVFILGGGPSLINFEFSRLKGNDVIAVNNAIFHFPSAKYFITKDYTWLKKNRLNNPSMEGGRKRIFITSKAKKYFAVGLHGTRLKILDKKICVDTKFGLEYNLNLFDKVIFTKRDGGIGLSFEDFRNGSDSGYSGLQLAIVLGYKKIYLLGFDFMVAGDRTHFHFDYGNQHNDPVSYFGKLCGFIRKYPRALEEIKSKTNAEVFSCSEISQLNRYIPFVNINEILN